MLGWAQADDLDEQSMLKLNLNEWARRPAGPGVGSK